MSTCIWNQDLDDSETYETACNNMFVFTDGCPPENNFVFCPFCGKVLEERKSDDDSENI